MDFADKTFLQRKKTSPAASPYISNCTSAKGILPPPFQLESGNGILQRSSKTYTNNNETPYLKSGWRRIAETLDGGPMYDILPKIEAYSPIIRNEIRKAANKDNDGCWRMPRIEFACQVVNSNSIPLDVPFLPADQIQDAQRFLERKQVPKKQEPVTSENWVEFVPIYVKPQNLGVSPKGKLPQSPNFLQNALVENIRNYRAGIKDHSNSLTKVKNGYMYAGENKGNDKLKPKNISQNLKKEADIKTRLNTIVWQEVGSEGGVASINTYDNQIVTWGKGMGAKGLLPEVINNLFSARPDIRAMFLQAGIALVGNQWFVVNTTDNTIYTGDAALGIIQSDTQLLSLLIEIGENEAYKESALDAQWKAILNHAGKVKDYVYSEEENRYKDFWSDESVALAAHLDHWLPGYGWEGTNYESTKGDPFLISLLFSQKLGKKLSNNSYFVPQKPYNPLGSEHFGIFGRGVGAKGIGLKAIKDNTIEVGTSIASLEMNTKLSNCTFWELDKGNFYIYSPQALDAATISNLEKNKDNSDYYDAMKDFSVSEMLEKLNPYHTITITDLKSQYKGSVGDNMAIALAVLTLKKQKEGSKDKNIYPHEMKKITSIKGYNELSDEDKQIIKDFLKPPSAKGGVPKKNK